MTSGCSHLILVTRLKYNSGTVQHNLEKGMKKDEFIVIRRNILSADEAGVGFQSVQLH